MDRMLLVVVACAAAGAAPQLRTVDPEEPDALLKFTLTELQRAKVESREMDDCHGLEVASIDTRDEKELRDLMEEVEAEEPPSPSAKDIEANNDITGDATYVAAFGRTT
ncbi:hypothetical protein HPB50_025944 [Hyalomma asiaticum]|uniref:Uncharacterized protein n=1 Tax=Hyalomma asiaticum TaxID=266040 RepID=A0ACB7S464_HYAAI|nr:hypothetical protein HPB50_025944 [Hyalomma asiaticum]